MTAGPADHQPTTNGKEEQESRRHSLCPAKCLQKISCTASWGPPRHPVWHLHGHCRIPTIMFTGIQQI